MVACASCGVALLRDDEPLPPPPAEALLGRFHPIVADRLEQLLRHRGITHLRVDRDHDAELRVDPASRDDLRAELSLTWGQIVHALPEERAMEVLASGGAAPGWFDAPVGGWVDRSGRLVVDRADDDPTAVEEPRMTGPALASLGAILLLLGWYVGAADIVLVVGGAMTIVGVLLPR